MNGSGAAAVLAMFAGLRGAQFASFVYTAKGTGEVARHNVTLGAIVENVYRKDIAALEAVRPSLSGVEATACDEMLSSLYASLSLGAGNNPAYTNADTYVHLDGFPGVKVHKETGALYMTCLTNGKTVIEPGEYKQVKSAPKTLAKKALSKAHCRKDDLRTFCFTNLRRVAVAGDVVEIEGDVTVNYSN
jgi:hypothetical protein